MARVQAFPIADAASWALVADAVDRFEERLRDPEPPELVNYLPNEGHPLHTRVAAELVRVDLERSWEIEDPKPLESYRRQAPRLFEDAAALADVAYEEYRLRRLAGDAVTREEYSSRYGVSTTAWPAVDSSGVGRGRGLSGRSGARMPEPGESFAGFRLTRVLGRGAFATAFLAEQNDLAQRPVVLKVSHRRSLEPEHLARLQHTNIVPIYSVHESGGLLGVCMPFCGDKTLADVLSSGNRCNAYQSTVARADDDTVRKPSGPGSAEQRTVMASPGGPAPRHGLDADEAVRIVRDLARGLAHAHERGIVHRDLKPANVLMADDWRPMLLDFNLSDGAIADGAASLTVGGTLPYMAPEHLEAVRSGGSVGLLCDLYSVGVILFELLTGARPFPDRRGSFEAVVGASLEDRWAGPRPPRVIDPSISPAIEALVLKCLAPTPERRYRSANELADDLSRHLDSLPLKHSANPSVVERLSKWRRRHPRLTSGSAVGAAAAVLVALLVALGASRAQRVARLEADALFRGFQQDVLAARTLLSVPNIDHELLREGQAEGTALLDRVADTVSGAWQIDARADLLGPVRREGVLNDIAELTYLLARAEGMLAGNGKSPDVVEAESHASDGATSSRLKAQSLLSEGKFSAAATELRSLAESHPTDPVVWLLLGNAQAGAGQLADAEASLSVAASVQPDSYVARYNRGLCHLQQGEHVDAIADFSHVLTMRPELVCARLNRAIAYEAAGDPKASLADLDAALDTGSAPPRAYLLRSRLRQMLGDAPGAKQDRDKGLAAEPTDEAGWVARGVARLADDPEGARRDFREALTRYPGSTLALRNLVHVHADRLDQSNDALEALDAWIVVEPASANARVGRAVLHAREGRREASQRDLDALGEVVDPLIAFQAACALSLTADRDNGDMPRALAYLSSAFSQRPGLVGRAATDPDLTALRLTEGYRDLVTAYRDLAIVRKRIGDSSSIGNP